MSGMTRRSHKAKGAAGAAHRRKPRWSPAAGDESFRAVLASLSDTIISIFGPDCRIRAIWGPSDYPQRHGVSLDSYIGQHVTQFFPKPIARERVRRLKEVLRTGKTTPHEYPFDMPNGRVWMETTFSPMRGADGKINAVLTFAREITERRQAELALRAASRQLVIAREDERKRLARELHDAVGQQLVALHLTLKAAMPEPGRPAGRTSGALLQKAAAMSGELIREIRDISQDIYPATLESLGLAASLRQLASRMACGIRVQVRCPRSMQAMRFDPGIEITLFRVAQEALSNACRHSKATAAVLRLEHSGGNVGIGICDNGTGFDPYSARPGGTGLQTMAHRVEAIGGNLAVTSRPGATKIEARVPVRRPDPSGRE